MLASENDSVLPSLSGPSHNSDQDLRSTLRGIQVSYENLVRRNSQLEKVCAIGKAEIDKLQSRYVHERESRQALLRHHAEVVERERLIQQSLALRLVNRWWRFKDRFLTRKNSSKVHTSTSPQQSGETAPRFTHGKTAEIERRYAEWIKKYEPTAKEIEAQREESKKLSYRPLLSVVIPVYKTPVLVLEEALLSLQAQTYDHFEVCLAHAGDDAACASVLRKFSTSDSRFKVITLTENKNISGNTNAALEIATGEFIALMDHDDTLAPFAFYELVSALNVDRTLDIIYSDEDKITEAGQRCYPFFKPDFSPELLHSSMYIGHLTLYRKTLIDSLGGFRSEFDGSQDYDLILRATEQTSRIKHISKVLYHWRMIPASAASGSGAKNYARVTNLAALDAAMKRRGWQGRVEEYPYSNRYRFELRAKPLVSVIIPSDDYGNIEDCVRALSSVTQYEPMEVLVVTNSTLISRLEADTSLPKFRCVRFDAPFNFSAKCNAGAQAARGEYFLFLNDDVAPLSPDWIESLLEYAQQDDVGGVSPKLLYEDNSMQYAGMVTGVRDMVGTSFHQWPRHETSYQNIALSTRNVTLLSGACCIVRKDLFWQIGGWDAQNVPIMNSDIDLSLKIRALGKRLVYTPFAELRHIGHKSIGKVNEGRRFDDLSHLYVLERWGAELSYDPYFTDEMRRVLYPIELEFSLSATSNTTSLRVSQNDPRKVLLLSHDLSLSGAPMILMRLAQYLHQQGWFVVVMAPSDGRLHELYQDEGIPVVIDPLIISNPYELKHLFAPYDLVVSNTVLGWNPVRCCAETKKPSVWMVHESEFGLEYVSSHEGAREAFALPDLVLYPSQRTKDLYEFFARDNRHISVPYGVADAAAIVGSPSPRKVGAGRLKITHSGSIEHRKGADLLLEALRILPEEVSQRMDVRFVGRFHEPIFVERMLQLSRELPHVTFVGEVSHDEALRYISDSDIFVCSSRHETGPLVVLEAMSLGCAVISTNVGAAGEHIKNGENGLLVPCEDAKSLASALLELAQDDRRRETLALAGRKTFERCFTLDRYHGQLESLFMEIVQPGIFAQTKDSARAVLSVDTTREVETTRRSFQLLDHELRHP